MENLAGHAQGTGWLEQLHVGWRIQPTDLSQGIVRFERIRLVEGEAESFLGRRHVEKSTGNKTT